MDVTELSQAQCILLAVHFASESNIKALHTFTPARSDVLDPELVLRILLSYLPESLAPAEYTSYIGEVGSRLYLDAEREDVTIDTSPVRDLPEHHAQKKVNKLKILELKLSSFPPQAPEDALTRFLCHRASKIDEETGLLNLLPQLIEPFLDRNDYIRVWYISVVLPLIRLEFEYYPEDEQGEIGLQLFEDIDGKEGIEFLLSKAVREDDAKDKTATLQKSTLSRDIKGLVGPWMYGHTDRKRRKLGYDEPDGASNDTESLTRRVRKISLSGVQEEDKTGHDWEYCYRWLVLRARTNFPLVTSAIEDWDGPGDVDLGGYEASGIGYLDEDTQGKLELQYAQAAFATCYAVEADTESTIKGAHGILARLAELLDFIPPPDLATSVDSLPQIERHALVLDKSRTTKDLLPDALLTPEHPLTTPKMETYMLLQMMVYSAYQFSGLGHDISIVNVAKLHFYATAEEQLDVLQTMLRAISKAGKRDDTQWTAEKSRLIWLWNWGIDAADSSAQTGAGVLGKINRQTFDEEMLKVFVDMSSYDLAVKAFVIDLSSLSPERVESTVLAKAMEAYDGASNGNKTRGGVKKANDIIIAFRSHFPGSTDFRQASSLIAATHALSFYSLKLQRGVPFQPVSIRVSQDPLSLISKVLEQNPRSYAKLDDLVGIAKNLTLAGLPRANADGKGYEEEEEERSVGGVERRTKDAERRVTFMAVEAAMREDDFETAYSYIVNRLTPNPSDITAPSDKPKAHRRTTSKGTVTGEEDDISWRAALLAGRYRPATSSPPTLRRLEQRTELLSLALLLAPASALTEILAVWRRCEEETTALQTEQAKAEEEFDDNADKRNSTALPGTFGLESSQPELVLNQKRREMGRMNGKGNDDVPVSMFDLTRSAARAFSKNAFPLHAAATRTGSTATTGSETEGLEASLDSLGSGGEEESQQRLRKRDMVANAASGALASGLGWVLGASPASQPDQQR